MMSQRFAAVRHPTCTNLRSSDVQDHVPHAYIAIIWNYSDVQLIAQADMQHAMAGLMNLGLAITGAGARVVLVAGVRDGSSSTDAPCQNHSCTDRLAMMEAIGAAALIEAQVEGAMSKVSVAPDKSPTSSAS